MSSSATHTEIMDTGGYVEEILKIISILFDERDEFNDELISLLPSHSLLKMSKQLI